MSLVRPIRVAVIGSGPSAFYSAGRLLSHSKGDDVRIDMYERLPTPNGLVRFGVAPDHPEVKNVEHKFAQIASDRRFHFYGNVNVVGDAASIPSTYDYPSALSVGLSDLLPYYTHVLLAYGCSLSRALGIAGSRPGELRNVHSALDFVNWYNGHPAAHDEAFLQRRPWQRVTLDDQMRHATIVGAGNVALDVARILLRSKTTLHDLFHADTELKARAALRATDVPECVLQTLSQSRIDTVDIVARRGPAQVAFTNKELREMMELQHVHFQRPRDEHIRLANEQVAALEQKAKATGDDESAAERQAAASEARVRKRLLSIVEKGSKATSNEATARWTMDFFKSPSAILGSGAVQSVRWDEMEFQRVPSTSDRDSPWSGSNTVDPSKISSTGRQTDTQTDLVVASVGYQALQTDDAIPWNARQGTVHNRGGQVTDEQGQVVPGMYVSGWLARGPVGVIASTRIDANSVAEQLLQDWQSSNGQSGLKNVAGQADAARTETPKVLKESTKQVVSWDDWLRLDAEEIRRGKELGKLREKVVSIEEMLRICA